MGRRLKFFIGLFLFLALGFMASTLIYFSLNAKIEKRLLSGWVIPPLELYSKGIALSVGRKIPLAQVHQELIRKDLHPERDYKLTDPNSCKQISGLTINDKAEFCLWLRRTTEGTPLLVTWDHSGLVQELWTGDPWQVQISYGLFPRLITQFFDGQPIMQQNTKLGEIPLACLQAVTAIEDRDFLEHGGVSVTGILRAVMRNLKAGRWAEGGSTITQQLVKNFFLSSKKTLRRKLEEQILAVMLETQITKDQILEMYLNVIYMGQSGPYQVRGFGSAALNYFDKPVSQLNLSECAMLAALVNNPGRYSPLTHAVQAHARRELVLHKMFEMKMLSESELTVAKAAPLPTPMETHQRTHAPYFVMAALKEFTVLGIEAEDGARLYTTLDPELQGVAEAAIQKQLPLVEKKIKKPSVNPLQVALLSVDLDTLQVMALVGGREFRSTQFNRAVDSRRQIGSIVKPFVFLPALEAHDPLTPILNDPLKWKTGSQVWQPKNYEGTEIGPVPYFIALAKSLNIPTARVGQEVGLEAIADALTAAGVNEPIPLLPSLTLGALELSPLMVAQMYSALGRLGESDRIHMISRIETLNGSVLHSHTVNSTFSIDKISSGILVGMMQQSFQVGSARSAQLLGVRGPVAGKTGTTSETKDAWFAGFTPRLLTVVWVGYDDNVAMGLTGASAALPIWTELMLKSQSQFAPSDFKWPEGVEVRSISKSKLQEQFPNLKDLPDETSLVFRE